MTNMPAEGTCTTFTYTCACEEPVQVLDGQEQPHECRPITAQQVRDAWASGYRFALAEERPAGDVLKEGWRRRVGDELYYHGDRVMERAVAAVERQIIPSADPAPDPAPAV